MTVQPANPNDVFTQMYPEGIPTPGGSLPVGWIGLRVNEITAGYFGENPTLTLTFSLEVTETQGHNGETSTHNMFVGDNGNPEQGMEPDPHAQNPETWKRRGKLLEAICQGVGVQSTGKTVGQVCEEVIGRPFLGHTVLEKSDRGEFVRLINAKPFDPAKVVVDENPTAKERKGRKGGAASEAPAPLGAAPGVAPGGGQQPPGFGGVRGGMQPAGAKIPAGRR